ncbi:MAG TPA: hypothetical protein VNZ57_09490, partial [Longimicrobiales bacterium]|nr:hypothetical protein [Longimicrobiales bacterium]
ATGEDDAAEEHFVRALEALTPEERAEYESIELLLAGGERSVYRRMEASERVEYEAAVWRIADPLLLTPGNEAWTDHMARHVWIELLSRSPRVNGTVSWGSDLRELTLRYGVPVSRERIPAAFVWDSEIHMLERYSPDQLWYVPAELRSRGLPQRPDPGEPWHLDEPAARSGHTPRAFTLVDLPHQVTRFPFGDSILVRVDGWVRADTAAERAEIATGLFMLFDESHEVAYRALRDTAVAAGDSIVMTLWATMPPGDYVYSIEALDAAAGQGARARYPVTLPAPTPGQLTLSDILVTRPLPEDRTPESRTDPAIVPRPRLDLPVGASIGIYAEAHSLHASANGLARYSVELALEPDRRGIPVIRWFGNLLGLGGDTETGVRWTAEAPGDDPAIIAVNLALHDLDRGLYTVRLTVRDLVSGDVAESTRRIRLR